MKTIPFVSIDEFLGISVTWWFLGIVVASVVSFTTYHLLESKRDQRLMEEHRADVESRILPAPDGWTAVKVQDDKVKVFRTADTEPLSVVSRRAIGLDTPGLVAPYALLTPSSKGIIVTVEHIMLTDTVDTLVASSRRKAMKQAIKRIEEIEREHREKEQDLQYWKDELSKGEEQP